MSVRPWRTACSCMAPTWCWLTTPRPPIRAGAWPSPMPGSTAPQCWKGGRPVDGRGRRLGRPAHGAGQHRARVGVRAGGGGVLTAAGAGRCASAQACAARGFACRGDSGRRPRPRPRLPAWRQLHCSARDGVGRSPGRRSVSSMRLRPESGAPMPASATRCWPVRSSERCTAPRGAARSARRCSVLCAACRTEASSCAPGRSRWKLILGRSRRCVGAMSAVVSRRVLQALGVHACPGDHAFFGFEPSYRGTTDRMPMTMRLRLDRCGIKLPLAQWRTLPGAARETLVEAPDSPRHIERLRAFVQRRAQQSSQ